MRTKLYIRSYTLLLLFVIVINNSFSKTLAAESETAISSADTTLSFTAFSALDSTVQDSLITTVDFLETLDSLTLDSMGLNMAYVDSLKNLGSTKSLPVSPNGPEQKVQYTAKDSIELDNINEELYLYGEANVKYGQMTIEADKIVIHLKTNQIDAYGKKDSLGKIIEKVRFQDGEEFFLAPEMKYNFKSKKGKIRQIYTQEGELHLHAKKAKKMPDDNIFVKKGKITTCDHEDPHFYFEASKLKVIPQKVMVAGPTHLVIRDFHTPIWVPFGIFPNNPDKQSGIIIPSQGVDNGQAGIKELGYHWAMSEYLHSEYFGSIYFGGTFRLAANFQYKKNYKFNGSFNAKYNNVVTGTSGLSDHVITRDYNFQWNHKQDPKAHPKSSFTVGINYKSPTFNQTQILNHTTATTLQQGANSSQMRWDWREKWGTIAINSRLDQNFTNGQTTVKAPNVTMNVRNQKIVGNLQISGNVAFENSTTTEDSLFQEQVWENMKNGLRATSIVDFGRSYSVLKYLKVSLPALTVNGYANSKYITRELVADTVQESVVKKIRASYDIGVGNFGVNTKIYGLFKFREGAYIEAFRHTITPGATLSYSPDFFINSQDIIRSYIDEKGDKIEYSIYENRNYSVHSPTAREALRMNYSFRNNLQAKVRSRKDTVTSYNKVNVINDFNVSGSYNFLAEEYHWSDVSLILSTNPGFVKNLNFSATLSPYAVDDSTGVVLDELLWSENKIGRLTSFRAQTNFALKRSIFTQEDAEELKHRTFDWTMNIGYTFTYSKPGIQDPSLANSIVLNGDVNLSENWRFSYRIPYNIKTKNLDQTSSINITRSLHCWEMTVNWLPFSQFANYTFTIAPKAGMLSDLKYEKVRNGTN